MGKQQFKIDNLKIIDYVRLNPKHRGLVDYMVKEYSKPNPLIRVNSLFKIKHIKPKNDNLWMLSWSDIIELKQAINDKDILTVLRILYQLSEADFVKLNAFNCFSAYKWCVESLKEIYDAEIERLEEDIPDTLKDAGIEELEEYGYVPALDRLANGDITRYDEFLNMPYAKVFRKLAMDVLTRKINEKYQENVSRRNKTNSRRGL
jgi:hypothetical protein